MKRPDRTHKSGARTLAAVLACMWVATLGSSGRQQPATPAERTAAVYNLNLAGKYSEAEAEARRLLLEFEQTYGVDSIEVSKVLDQLVQALSLSRQFTDQSIEIAMRAVRVKESIHGTEHDEVARSLGNLGSLLDRAGRPSEAKAALERALAIREQVDGREDLQISRTLLALGRVYTSLSDLPRARSTLERAVAIAEKSAEGEVLAQILNSLGVAIVSAGDPHGARPHFERSSAILERVLGPEHPRVAGQLGNLAKLLQMIGDVDEASRLMTRALAILEKAFGPGHPNILATLSQSVEILMMLEDWTSARQRVEQLLPIQERVWGPEHQSTLISTRQLAYVLVALGEYGSAVPLAERAARTFEKTSGMHPHLTGYLATYAAALAGSGRPLPAFEVGLRSVAVWNAAVRSTSPRLAERDALLYANQALLGWDVALSELTGDLSSVAAARSSALDSLIQSRALLLDEMAERYRIIHETEDPKVRATFEVALGARMRLANLVIQQGSSPGQEEAAKLQQAQEEKQRAERALAERSEAFRRWRLRYDANLSEVSLALPPDSVLVAFTRFRGYEWKWGAGSAVPPFFETGTYAAFVHLPGTAVPALVTLGPAERIDDLIDEWRRQVDQQATSTTGPSRRLEEAYRVVATELRQKVWDPLTPHLGNAKLVMVVPEGPLHLVDFAALPTDQTRYLAETGPVIHYLATERDVLQTGSTRVPNGLLVVGAPAFDDSATRGQEPPIPVTAGSAVFRGQRSGCSSFQAMQFETLPASEQEARDIASLWSRSSGSSDPQVGATIVELGGARATEAAFKAHAQGKRVLHLATHGFFLGGPCLSALDEPVKQRGTRPTVTAENPLLLSGLALAGANQRHLAGPDDEDGILTAEEIAALDLAGVEWAVLSACDTGVGEIKAGEGVFGLRRAFQIAGVRTVVMSLWQVEDESTRRWMRTLYQRRFVAGRSTADAVRDASLELLRARRARGQSTHPFYWAGFVAAGDWR